MFIRETLLLVNGEEVNFYNIDMSCYLDKSYNTSLRRINPIVKAIGHPIILTARTISSEGIVWCHQIALVEYGGEGSTMAKAIKHWRINHWKESSISGKPTSFEANLDNYRRYEIKMSDMSGLIVELDETQMSFKELINNVDELAAKIKRMKF